MPRYVVECDSGFCGVNETIIVEANNEMVAEDIAYKYWLDMVAFSVTVSHEATEEDEDEGFSEID